MNIRKKVITLWGVALVLSACTWPGRETPRPIIEQTPVLNLVVQVQNQTDTFDSVGDEIRYSYTVTNSGSQALAGPIAVNDNIAAVTCPELTTVGNQDNSLDPGETVICTGTYLVSQAALDAGSVANLATASAAAGSILSAPSGITVTLVPGKRLGLAKSADLQTYNFVGQAITYTYVITNTGNLAIGPAQFMISDDHIGGAVPFACGQDGTTLEPGITLTCTSTYTITQQDMGASSVTNTATASGGDAQASAPVSATITNGIFLTPEVGGPSNLTPGSTIQHTVEKGEWMIQIARCYGVSYESLRRANLHISNPSVIDPGQVLTVPNIGSAGTIYDKPCVIWHTVAAGETWNSIATRYNARVDVLQEANRGGLVVGAQIKVPVNSAGGTSVQVPVTGGATTTSTPTLTPTATVTLTATPTVTSMVINTPVTVTPTLGTTTPGLGQPIRITIPPGTNSTLVTGTLISRETVSYVVAASQGQSMTVNVAASPSDIALKIHDPSGLLIKPLDGNLNWTGLLSTTGDFRIDLVGLTDSNKNYMLSLTITSP
jgi:LysM repeat protein